MVGVAIISKNARDPSQPIENFYAPANPPPPGRGNLEGKVELKVVFVKNTLLGPFKINKMPFRTLNVQELKKLQKAMGGQFPLGRPAHSVTYL